MKSQSSTKFYSSSPSLLSFISDAFAETPSGHSFCPPRLNNAHSPASNDLPPLLHHIPASLSLPLRLFRPKTYLPLLPRHFPHWCNNWQLCTDNRNSPRRSNYPRNWCRWLNHAHSRSNQGPNASEEQSALARNPERSVGNRFRKRARNRRRFLYGLAGAGFSGSISP